MHEEQLVSTAQRLVAPRKGILAADESTGTITRRLDSIHVPSTEATRQAYREMLFTTPGVEAFISGVILYEETLGQATSDKVPFPDYLTSRGIIPGIKVDVGAQKMALFPNELVTEGLDGLRGRLSEYYARGARFAKWRAVITIGDGIPSEACIDANAHALARYAALCQEAGIVPIVEPEVLMDGAHDIERCAAVTAQTLNCVYDWLWRMRVLLEGTLLKPNMVLPGAASGQTAEPEAVAAATLEVLKRCVPAAVPGIVFLSGGQSAEEATANLSAMNAMGPAPWELSFSYGRALQQPSLSAWGGKKENVPLAQALFAKRAKLNGAAREGTYAAAMEDAG
ncbi:MAG: class I fructose-bisphosphate aldolase [Anaerolineae bacterium]